MNLTYSISPDRRALTILADAEARQELIDLGEDVHSDSALTDAFDRLLSNSELKWISPVTCGDMTEAPILGILGDDRWVAAHVDGDGTELCGADYSREENPVNVVPVLERWGYMGYQVDDLLETLRDTGKAVFLAP